MGTSSQYYVVELPLRIGDEESRRLAMAFEFGRTIYNATLGQALGKLTHMRQSTEWKNAFLIKKVSDRNAELKRIQKKYGLNEFGLGDMAANHRKASGKTNLIGFTEAKFIGFTVWRALERYIYAKGGRPRFKTKRRGLHSMYCCGNRGIIWKPQLQSVVWRGYRFPALVKHTAYFQEALGSEDSPRQVKICRIVRRILNCRERWFVQLVMVGLPPVRHVYAPKSETIGLDIPSKVAMVSPNFAGFTFLSPYGEIPWAKIRNLRRKMARSLRAMNPDNYEPSGATKKGAREWKRSNHYEKLLRELADLYRRAAETRKRDHGALINSIFEQAGTVNLETISYRSYQRNFGRSAQRQASGLFVQRLKRKAESAALTVNELDTRKLRMSQYDHRTQTYTRKPLQQRWHSLGGSDTLVSRDIYSALLACCVKNGEHDPVSIERCWQAVEHQLKSAGFVRDIKLPRDSCRGSCGTHRRVSHQRQCRRKFSVSTVTSDRASLSKLASSEKLLMYRNLLNNQAVVRSPLNVLEIFRQSHEKRRNLSDLLEVIQVITRKPRYRSGSPVRAVPACC